MVMRSGGQTVVLMADNRWEDRPCSTAVEGNTWPGHGPGRSNCSSLHAAARINRVYAERQGYAFEAFEMNKTSCDGLKPSPCKLIAVHAVLARPETEAIVFADSDAIFRDHDLSVQAFLAENNVSRHAPLVVPTDCSPFLFNGGIHIWRNGAAARALVAEWIARSKTLRSAQHFPWEQRSLQVWYNMENSSLRRQVAILPWGKDRWHLGYCRTSKTPGKYRPARWLSHITGGWPLDRFPVMRETLLKLGLTHGQSCNCSRPFPRVLPPRIPNGAVGGVHGEKRRWLAAGWEGLGRAGELDAAALNTALL